MGRGVQGRKRRTFCGDDFVAYVDPFDETAEFRTIADVPHEAYDRVLGCIPDDPKCDLLRFCLENKKHLLVEKPLQLPNPELFDEFASSFVKNRIFCYTAYNHRFEPHFIRMKDLLLSGVLGKIYRCRMFYGNGTARQVRESNWRDTGAGVLADLGSHLLDTVDYWFGSEVEADAWQLVSHNNFENRAPDHVVIGNFDGNLSIELEMTMLMWRNHFTCDILGENGSAHIHSLCKWGPSKFVVRERKLPSGRPDEEQSVLIKGDPTWAAEYEFFNKQIKQGNGTNLEKDKNLFLILQALQQQLDRV